MRNVTDLVQFHFLRKKKQTPKQAMNPVYMHACIYSYDPGLNC